MIHNVAGLANGEMPDLQEPRCLSAVPRVACLQNLRLQHTVNRLDAVGHLRELPERARAAYYTAVFCRRVEPKRPRAQPTNFCIEIHIFPNHGITGHTIRVGIAARGRKSHDIIKLKNVRSGAGQTRALIGSPHCRGILSRRTIHAQRVQRTPCRKLSILSCRTVLATKQVPHSSGACRTRCATNFAALV